MNDWDDTESAGVSIIDLVEECVEVQVWDVDRKSDCHIWFAYEGKWGSYYSFDVVAYDRKDRLHILATLPMQIATRNNKRALQRLYDLFRLIHDGYPLGTFTCTEPNVGRILIQWSYQCPLGMVNDHAETGQLLLDATAEVDAFYDRLRTVLVSGDDAQEAFDMATPPSFGMA
jgi:hypothetical protein